LLLAGAVWSFERRDIANGASDWTLRKLLPWTASPPSRHVKEAEPIEEPGA
jgi:hypothetical protein